MAKKTRRRQAARQSARASGSAARPAVPGAAGAGTAAGAPAPAQRVEMSLGPRQAARRGTRAAGVAIEDADPSIPLDRVPYFLTDLRKLGITAAVMVVLMVAGAQLLPHIIK